MHINGTLAVKKWQQEEEHSGFLILIDGYTYVSLLIYFVRYMFKLLLEIGNRFEPRMSSTQIVFLLIITLLVLQYIKNFKKIVLQWGICCKILKIFDSQHLFDARSTKMECVFLKGSILSGVNFGGQVHTELYSGFKQTPDKSVVRLISSN